MDVPRPLHIIKRPDSRWSEKTSSSRRQSVTSTDSDTSIKSTPEPPWGDRPLTVTKRRGNYNTPSAPRPPASRPRRSASQADPHETENTPPAHRSPNKGSLLFLGSKQYEDGLEGSETVRRGRLSPVPSVASSPAAVRRRPQIYRQELRGCKSMLQVGRPTRRSFDSISESPPMESESESELLSDLVPTRFQQEPSVLVPRIVVTPEAKIIGDGATTVWAAVQVLTQVCPSRGSDCRGYQGDPGWKAGRYQGGRRGSQEGMLLNGKSSR
jgi:hypothetical protein